MARLLATFGVEADEHLTALRRHLLDLAGATSDAAAHELVQTTFRDMHTLKGAARSVGQRDVERVCASCEALLSALTRAETAPSPAIVALLEEATAAIASLVAGGPGTPVPNELLERLDRAEIDPAAVDAPPAAPAADEASPTPAAGSSALVAAASPAPAVATAAPAADAAAPTALAAAVRPSTIRLATDDLDTLLRRGEDLLAIKLAADEWLAGAEALHEQLRRATRAADPLAELKALEASARAMVGGLRRDRRSIAGAVDGLLEQAQRVRMMPASSVLDVLPLIVRDLARAQGKQVVFSATGGDARIDRRVLEAIKDPLIHMVRNAVDHGLETPEERAAAGKSPTGRITATVRALESGRVEFVLTDDGRGIDSDRVHDAARRARIAVAPDEDPLALVFRSGLSTSFVITDVSGHGLGLAIVKDQVGKLGGSVELESTRGQGTTIRLLAPATIATFRGLLVRAGGQRFLLPLDAIERVIAAEPIAQGGLLKVRYEDELLPCAPLAELLGLEAGEHVACAILNTGSGRAGVLVEDMVGDREVLIKDFEPPLIRVRHIAAAGLLGAGELVLVLRPADLVAGAAEPRGARTSDVTPPESPPWVLVVDDAVTTRAMERGLLELAGYQVKVAVDGVDAWTTLKTERFDLVVSDVDMPRMNGFELTQRIRADETLQDLPVVLVSALEAREDQERGIEVGANAYVVKSSFEQSNLLEIIHRLGVTPQ
ncbi:hybrid sensor histidine kinase/response regulator [Solirubrobacter soli]|uniref:hybrid sensor histidine kinase/response regulator n=1 Tax=Solirubrobacter soli TaxID=363832 RepID=UPI0003F50C51|nr:response regulator [Solirubrobacter soli]